MEIFLLTKDLNLGVIARISTLINRLSIEGVSVFPDILEVPLIGHLNSALLGENQSLLTVLY